MVSASEIVDELTRYVQCITAANLDMLQANNTTRHSWDWFYFTTYPIMLVNSC